MTIQIYRKNDYKLLEEWDNYPIVPSVGDRVTVYGKALSSKVESRVFSKAIVKLIID